MWARPRDITTRNAACLPRFQSLCEQYDLKPTYLTNWEMARSPTFQEFGRDILARETGEIGMHLHAWNSPPLVVLTPDDDHHQPFLIDYTEDRMREKVKTITGVLEDTFGVDLVSHRAGRWSFNEKYARILVDNGYHVDCSVTPHVSWQSNQGDPAGNGGTNFSRFPETAYFVDLNDISRAGHSPLLELPMTIVSHPYPRTMELARRFVGKSGFGARAMDHFLPSSLWLRPARGNREALLYILSVAGREKRAYVEFMLHSSELMPGGSPCFPSAESIEVLYDDLEALFAAAVGVFEGRTLDEYYRQFTGSNVAVGQQE